MTEHIESACWPWPGTIHKTGYGRAGKTYAHRYAYELLVGPIPEGMQIDHLCRNKACFNPDHLEAVTPGENTRRGLSGRLVTHCPRGHEYDEKNTYIDKYGHRDCRECTRIRKAAARTVCTPDDDADALFADVARRSRSWEQVKREAAR